MIRFLTLIHWWLLPLVWGIWFLAFPMDMRTYGYMLLGAGLYPFVLETLATSVCPPRTRRVFMLGMALRATVCIVACVGVWHMVFRADSSRDIQLSLLVLTMALFVVSAMLMGLSLVNILHPPVWWTNKKARVAQTLVVAFCAMGNAWILFPLPHLEWVGALLMAALLTVLLGWPFVQYAGLTLSMCPAQQHRFWTTYLRGAGTPDAFSLLAHYVHKGGSASSALAHFSETELLDYFDISNVVDLRNDVVSALQSRSPVAAMAWSMAKDDREAVRIVRNELQDTSAEPVELPELPCLPGIL